MPIDNASEERLTRIEKNVDRLAEMVVVLARVEERSNETRTDVSTLSTDVKELGKRLGAIEVALPPLIETRAYVIRGVIGLVSIVGIAVVGLVVKAPELVGLITGG